MTVLAVVLAAVIVIQYVLHQRQLSTLIASYEAERASLLDRIQHPQVRQVEPAGEPVEYEPPKDEAELAQVGQVVPEFVQVGTHPNEG